MSPHSHTSDLHLLCAKSPHLNVSKASRAPSLHDHSLYPRRPRWLCNVGFRCARLVALLVPGGQSWWCWCFNGNFRILKWYQTLAISWWFQLLWTILVNWDDYFPIHAKIKNVPNHQAVSINQGATEPAIEITIGNATKASPRACAEGLRSQAFPGKGHLEDHPKWIAMQVWPL